jgi:glycosyltransferase involved in cell wall biosynthesis
MRIAYIVPSSGGSFYCSNCIRDLNLIEGLRQLGEEVVVVPMYLPLDDSELQADTQVFYGAVGLYLRQQLPWLRRAPEWVDRMLDSGPLLNIAAGLAGSTRASSLGDMTLSMLRGEKGGQAQELEQLVTALKDTVKPEVVHLSNALLLGTVRRIKKETSAAVVCTLEDEHTWIDALDLEQAGEARRLLAEASADVEVMLPVSSYYAEFFRSYAPLKARYSEVIPVCVDIRDTAPEPTAELGPGGVPNTDAPPTIGYLSRMCAESGLEILVDAVAEVRRDPAFRDLRLWITGGSTGDDRAFLRRLRGKIRRAGMETAVRFFPDFSNAARKRFLRDLVLLSVPSTRPTAFGLYLLEAMAAGVPVVQPEIGSYPEIIRATGGGILYRPNDAPTLASGIRSLLLDGEKWAALSAKGRTAARKLYGLEAVAKKLAAVYKKSLELR